MWQLGLGAQVCGGNRPRVWLWQLGVFGCSSVWPWQLDMIGTHEFDVGSCMWLVPACLAVAVYVVGAHVCGMAVGCY